MELDEISKIIADSKGFLEDYKMYGQMVSDAINALDRLEGLVADPSNENLAEALTIAKELNNQLGPYSVYVPSISASLEKLLQWLQKRTG